MYAADQLQGRLPSDLRARVEERVFLEVPGHWRRTIFPDVRIDERRGAGQATRGGPAAPAAAAAAGNGGVAVAVPMLIHVQAEPARSEPK